MKETILKVEGMSCSGCVNAVRNALTGIKGVEEAVVSLEESSARIVHVEEAAVADLVAAIEAAGYTASSVE
jgi:copper chaperone CopZ